MLLDVPLLNTVVHVFSHASGMALRWIYDTDTWKSKEIYFICLAIDKMKLQYIFESFNTILGKFVQNCRNFSHKKSLGAQFYLS